jgi:hypothetical protein
MEEEMKKLLILSMLFLVVFGSRKESFAQGEAAVPFLLISPGASYGALGEAGVAYTNDANAIFWNPAGLAFQYVNPKVDKRTQVTFMHAKWLPQFNLSDLFYEYAAGRYYIDGVGMVGMSITFLNLGKNVWTDEQGNNLGTFESFEWAATVSYGTKVAENVSIGVNAKFIQSNLSNVQVGAENQNGTASSFAVDIGTMWIPDYDFLQKNLRLGLNVSNIGPKISYIDDKQADPLPTNFKAGLSYKIYDDEFNRLTFVYDMNKLLVVKDSTGHSDNVLEAMFYSAWAEGSWKDLTHSLGLEYWYGDLIALRAGWFYEDPSRGGRTFYTFGAGLKYSLFGIDFAYIAGDDNSPLSGTMRFSLAISF